MRKGLFIIAILLTAAALPREAEAQNVLADTLRLRGGPCTERAGSGSPEGAVAAKVCDTYRDGDTGEIYQKIVGAAGTNTGWYRIVGPSAATCTTFAGCVAVSLTTDYLTWTQKLRTDGSYQFRSSVATDGTRLESYNASGWMPFVLAGGPVRVKGGGFHVGATDILDPGLGNAQIDGFIGKPGYVSQTTGWRIDGLGAADLRYLYTDELHARKFIADLEQALAGLQIIAKSVGQIGAVFTVPAPGSISTLTMKDLPSAANMAIFESGDTVWIRTFSRAGGSLSITNAYGTVTSYTDLADGLQSWQFTRLITNGGAMSTGTEVEIDSIVLDVGVSGNGWVETNAVDGLYGINAPYTQVVTWSGDSPIAGNQKLRARLGNLRGITGVTGEFGLIAGTYAASGGRYLRASNEAFDLVGIDLKQFNGATNVYRLDHATPYESMGSPAPTTYGAGVGCWSGMDAGVYKWRCGDPAGHNIAWTGASLNVVGNIVVEGFIAEDTNNVNGVASATVASGAARANLGLTSAGNPALPATAAPSGSGLFLGSDFMGYYASGAWQTYMTNAGNFFLGGASGPLQWNAGTSTLTITGTINVTGGTAAKTDLSNVTGGYAASSSAGGSATALVNQGALATVNSAAWGTQVSGRPAELTDGRITTALGANGALQNAVAAPTSGAGLKLGNDHLGFYDGAAWKTYMDNTGQFFLGGPSGALQWNGTTLTISATLSGNGAGITSISGGNITASSILTAALAAGAVTAEKISVANLNAVSTTTGSLTVDNALTVGTGGDIRSGATGFTTGTGYWLAYNAGTPQFRVGNPVGNRLMWDGFDLEMVSETVTIDDGGITINAGENSVNQYKFTNGNYFKSFTGGTAELFGSDGLNLKGGTATVTVDNGSATGFGIDLGTTGNPWGKLYLNNDIYMFNPTETLGGHYPIVWDSTSKFTRYKSDGFDGTLCSAGAFVDDLVIERGIVISGTCTFPAPEPSAVAGLRREVSDLRALVASLLNQSAVPARAQR